MELKDTDKVWVCGTSFPPEGYPGRDTATWGRCKACGDEIVYNRDNDEELKDAVKVCMDCAFKAMEQDGVEPEVEMTERDEALFDEVFGKGFGTKLKAVISRVVEERLK